MSVSFASTLEQRTQLLTDINKSVRHLHRKFSKDPKKVKLEKIKRQVDKLVELNQQIAIQQKKQSKGCCNRCWSRIEQKSIFIIASVVLLFADSGLNVFYALFVDKAPGMLIVANFAAAVALGGMNFGLWWTNEDAQKKRDKEQKLLINNLSKSIKDLKIENFQNFLKSFRDFKKETQNNKRHTPEQKLKNCINCLEKVPPQFKDKLPSTNSWISLLLQLLENGHPLKLKFDLLYGNVEKINSSSSENVPEKFKSEKEPLNLKHPTQTSINSHQQIWQELEQELGFHLSYLEKNGTCFDRNVQTWEPEEEECVIDILI